MNNSKANNMMTDKQLFLISICILLSLAFSLILILSYHTCVYMPFQSAVLDKLEKEDLLKEVARIGMIAELDAVNLYEQLAAIVDDEKFKKVLLDIAKEEKTHLGEFQALLLEKDKEQVKELKEGKKEVEELG